MTATDPATRPRHDSWPGGTITDLVDWAHQRGLSPDDVTITGGHLKWTSPETPDERVRREEFQAERDARHERWELEQYARLWARFSGEPPDVPIPPARAEHEAAVRRAWGAAAVWCPERGVWHHKDHGNCSAAAVAAHEPVPAAPDVALPKGGTG